MADFEHRLEDRSQAYGMEQLLRFIGPAGGGRPAEADDPRGEAARPAWRRSWPSYGDAPTKEAASANAGRHRQVRHLRRRGPPSRSPSSRRRTPRRSSQPDREAVPGAARAVPGGGAVPGLRVDEEARRPAVGGLPPRVSRRTRSSPRSAARPRSPRSKAGSIATTPSDIQRILEIATADAPDAVLDQAFRRVGEMPRELVVEKLYGLFKTDKWKIAAPPARPS